MPTRKGAKYVYKIERINLDSDSSDDGEGIEDGNEVVKDSCTVQVKVMCDSINPTTLVLEFRRLAGNTILLH